MITATETVSEADTAGRSPDGDCGGRLSTALGATVADLAVPSRCAVDGRAVEQCAPGAAPVHYRLLLSTTLAEEIERVVVFGRPRLSRPVSRLLARDDLELVVVSAHADWIDPGRSASLVTDAVRLPDAGNGDWFDAWHRADQLVRVRLDALLKTQPYLTGPLLAATVWTALDDADALFAGSSSPVRDLDLAPITPLAPVVANRGLSGIDGNVPTAAGALALEHPTHALLGDLTALHDAPGTVMGQLEPRPDLRFVIANDDGGSPSPPWSRGEPATWEPQRGSLGHPRGCASRRWRRRPESVTGEWRPPLILPKFWRSPPVAWSLSRR